MLEKMAKPQERSKLDKDKKENTITEDRNESPDEPDGFFLSVRTLDWVCLLGSAFILDIEGFG